ncbi:MAG: DUF4332 domain-containing protein [Hyphomicrobiaceae bacterium]|nr:DUF4332 domain-containing protein [Hyphomicrobiaceae bacterium]
MKTCACCGQSISSTTRVVVQVDDALLQRCNQAFEVAVAQACDRVEVAHLVQCLMDDADAVAAFESFELQLDAVREAALVWLSARVDVTVERQPRTTDEFKIVLQRAQIAAGRAQRQYASVADVVDVLVHDVRDLDSASFVACVRKNRDGFGAVSERQQRGSDHARSGVAGWTVRASTLPAVSEAQSRSQTRGGWMVATTVERRELDRAGIERAEQNRSARTASGSGDQEVLHALMVRLDHYEQQLKDMTARLQDADGLSRRFKAQRAWSERLRRRTAGGWVRLSRDLNRERMGAQASGGRKGSAASSGRGGRENGLEPDEVIAIDASGERVKRFYLALDDEIVRAPSIGNRTASRLKAVGIERVRDLLIGDAAEISQKLGVRQMTAQRVADWQAQARLVCVVPWLRGTHAQLLVGAGFASVEELATADSGIVCAAILRFALTRDGQSVLRAGAPPDIERVLKWVQHAALAEPARAA